MASSSFRKSVGSFKRPLGLSQWEFHLRPKRHGSITSQRMKAILNGAHIKGDTPVGEKPGASREVLTVVFRLVVILPLG